ncbi:ASCH domain-containing protein [Alteromonadaceae bacterium M269]|nr:ASCH domain-containing protein [Alteromonadaceae bacterium M269]
MNQNKIHASVEELCRKFFESIGESTQKLDSWFFCDNEKDANECAALVLDGVKKATTPSLVWHQKTKTPLPKVGDLNVVTDWAGVAQCIIQTVSVEIVPFNQVTPEYAAIEGEGDKSLAYWNRVHWRYYARELEGYGIAPTEDMLVVCEIFKVVHKSS